MIHFYKILHVATGIIKQAADMKELSTDLKEMIDGAAIDSPGPFPNHDIGYASIGSPFKVI